MTFVDNDSSDASVAWVRDNEPDVRIIQREDNGGFATAVNAGIVAADSEYVVLLNNDTHADEHWLDELVKALDQNPGYELASSLMLLYYEDGKVNSAGDYYSVPMMAGRNRGLGKSESNYRLLVRVLGACAGASAYRRSIFDEIGLFDDDFFLMSEDTDINVRALIAGKKCLYVPTARIRHKVRASIDAGPSERMLLLADRNEAMVFAKDMPWPLIALTPVFWVWRQLRKTILLRPENWNQIPFLISLLPKRIAAERQGWAMGWRKRPDVWRRQAVSTLEIIRWLLVPTGSV